jgi:hypothetical protein
MILEVQLNDQELEVHIDDIDGNDIFWDFVDPLQSRYDLSMEEAIAVENQIRGKL